ncbi:MAG: SDR family oxidoreductase, partial [Myxococcota bacterium]
VNNAGLSAGKPIWEIEPELFREVCFSHLIGTFNCTRAVAPQMKERGHGRIVNLVSRAGLVGIAGNAAYGAGKGGVFGLTNVVSRDLEPFGVTVNAVNPSATDTRMVTEAIDRMRSAGDPASVKVAEGLSRALQTPLAVAVVIAALCSDEAAAVTGEIFYVAGSDVGLFEPLTVRQKLTAPESWTAETLAEALAGFEFHSLDAPYG